MALVFSSDSISFTFIFVAVILVTSCWSAPAEDPEWWLRPCVADIPKVRHSRSTDNPVQFQFKIFIAKLKISLKKINNLYGKAPNSKNGQMKGLKIKNMLQAIKKGQTQNKAYEKLHKALLQFAVTLEALRKVQIKNYEANFNKRERGEIYYGIAQELRRLLCEVEDFVPKKADIKSDPLKGIPSFDKPLDVTFAQLIDTTFLKKTKTFARQALKILRKVKKNKSEVQTKKRTFKNRLRQS